LFLIQGVTAASEQGIKVRLLFKLLGDSGGFADGAASGHGSLVLDKEYGRAMNSVVDPLGQAGMTWRQVRCHREAGDPRGRVAGISR